MNNDQQMNNNQPSREELDAATALLEQRRQAAQHYQEAQRARTNETNGTPDGDTPVDQTGDRTGQETPNGRAQQPDTHETDRQKDSSFLLRAAQLAQEKGNAKEAKALLRSLATLFPEPSVPKQTPPETPGALPSGEGETPAQVEREPKPVGQIVKVGFVLYIVGEVPDHCHAGLPSFYDTNVKAMRGSIPLTIFNPIWQREAAAYQAEKKTIDRPNSEERRHTSLPAPGEWTQSYAQWSRNYQNFIATLKEVYCFQIFSEWFRIHRDRCDQLMRREGFCAGFRYDLAVRANAFQ
ncbi:hypothetical protein PSTT_01700 [Puccinia striiformis]|uniref:Uncharacterized protein n=1 Tax=Puccinia striiformis TaxID=27350 RepID=A0A2S4W2N8_9BASI|nr:hypothetical protein PSTT_01700 [Puccinia striiformis]